MEHNEKPCVISCGILRKEIEHLLENGDIDAEVHFLSEKLHMDYDLLERGLNGALKKHQKQSPQGVIVVYGDVCLGFKGEMKALIDQYDVIKVDALNCIDCILGGKGKLLKMDPDHKYLFLNPAFVQFTEKIRGETKEKTRDMFQHARWHCSSGYQWEIWTEYQSKIDEIADHTCLPILKRKNIGLEGLKRTLLEAFDRKSTKMFREQIALFMEGW